MRSKRGTARRGGLATTLLLTLGAWVSMVYILGWAGVKDDAQSNERTKVARQPERVQPETEGAQSGAAADDVVRDRHLKSVLKRALAHWTKRGVPAQSFRLLRTETETGKPSAWSCEPFEKQHGEGHAADVQVSDLNRNGRLDLPDLCLFAASLDGVQGGVGVYGGAVHGETKALWVHVDVSGKKDRWGRWDDADGNSQLVVWSKRQRAAQDRCKDWGLVPDRSSLKLVVAKQPSVWVFKPHPQSLRLHPALHLYVSGRLVKTYPVALGGDPDHDKERRNDSRTPEGDFTICEKNSQSYFSKFLRLSYPNAEDAARGRRAGLIDRAAYRAIVAAIRNHEIPPQDTRLGSDIMIHAGGGTRGNWTQGCIAVDSPDIVEIYKVTPRGARITVLPAAKKERVSKELVSHAGSHSGRSQPAH